MPKEMLINVSEGEECRIALVENGRLDELYMERTSATSHVGNVYRGRVTNVEPSIQAAFIDFGLGRNGFLHISDLMPTYFGRKGEEIQESVGRKMARRDRPPIQRCLRRGDDIIVQIIKEGIGTKGPTLSTYVSIPGRILVMMPGMSRLGVSRKIEDEEERRRLRQILDSLKPPKDCGFIIRTAGIGKSKAEIQKDLNYLTRLWQNIEKKMKSGGGPLELYTEGDLVTRTVRDVFTPDIERIVVDNEDVAHRVKDFIKIALPRTKNKVELYEGPVPLFHKYGIEHEIEQMYSRHVPLESGGSLVIDSTEAIVAIDVNSGKFRDHADAETTAFKTDMEAADEIARQLRLRDLGGVIICDFIDLRYERHRRDLEKRLHDNLSNDRAKTKMLRMSQFGIIEMTRQRMRPSLKRSVYSDCPHCAGTGLVKTPESMALDVMRRLAIAVSDERVHHVELTVAPEVSFYLNNKKRAAMASLEGHWKKRIIVKSDNNMGMDAHRMQLFDHRDGLIFLPELGMAPPGAQAQQAHQPHQQQGRPQPQNQQQRGQQQQQQGRRDDRGRRAEPRRDEPRRDEPRRDDQRRDGQRRDGRQRDEQRRDDPRDQQRREEGGRDQRPDQARWQEQEQGGRGGRGGRDRGGRDRGRGGQRDPGRGSDASPVREDYADDRDERYGMDQMEDAVEEREENLMGDIGSLPPPPPPMETIDEVSVPAPRDEGLPEIVEITDEPEMSEPLEAAPEMTAEVEEAPAPIEVEVEDQAEVEAEPEAKPRRGRGGRGRGGRGRGPAAKAEKAEPAAAKAVAPAKAATAAPEEKEAKPKKTRRGTRGGRRTKKAGEAPADAAANGGSAEAGANAEQVPAAASKPAVRGAVLDRHMLNDEPVLPQPVSRPRTYRDLDHIPDDYD